MIMTLGHSHRSAEEFLAILEAAGVERLLDVRARPGSRRFPWFGRRPLARSLQAAGIQYQHVPALGGGREPRRDSPNCGLREDWQRGYADWMQGREFRDTVIWLRGLEAEGRSALMCAEADPRHCHRWLIADALICLGVSVQHLATPEGDYAHRGSRCLDRSAGWPRYPQAPGETLPLELDRHGGQK